MKFRQPNPSSFRLTLGGVIGVCRNIGETMKKPNKVVAEHDTWLEIDVSTKTYPHSIMKIDTEDWDNLLEMGIGRASAFMPVNIKYVHLFLNGKMCILHRLLIPSAKLIDHEDHNGLNNLRSNLRECSNSQNMMNRIPNRKSFSGIKGVYYIADRRQWGAVITKNKKTTFLGRFDNIEIAIGVRQQAERDLFGQFAYNQ